MQAQTVPQAAPPHEALSALSDEDFLTIVQSEQRGEVQSVWSAALRHPANVNRWCDALTQVKRDIEAQLTARAAELAALQQECFSRGFAGKGDYFSAKAEYDQWRAKAVWAKSKTENALTEAKRLAREHNVAAFETARTSRRRVFGSTLRKIADYDFDTDPQELGDYEAACQFFQRIAREALDGEGE